MERHKIKADPIFLGSVYISVCVFFLFFLVISPQYMTSDPLQPVDIIRHGRHVHDTTAERERERNKWGAIQMSIAGSVQTTADSSSHVTTAVK